MEPRRAIIAAGQARPTSNGSLVADCPFHESRVGPMLYFFPAPPNLMFHCFGCGVNGKVTFNADGSYTLDPMNAEQETLDRHYPAAVAIVSAAGYGANWLLRERLSLSYWRASFLIAALQEAGILGDELDEEARFTLIEPRGFH